MSLVRKFIEPWEVERYFKDIGKKPLDNIISLDPYIVELYDADSLESLAIIIKVERPQGSLPYVFIAQEDDL